MSFFSGVYSNSIGFTNQLGSQAKELVGMSGIFIGLGEVLGEKQQHTIRDQNLINIKFTSLYSCRRWNVWYFWKQNK